MDDETSERTDTGVTYPMRELPFEPAAAGPWWVGRDDPAAAVARDGGRWSRVALRVGGTGAAVVLAAAATGVVVHRVDDHGGSAAATTTVPAAAPVASVETALAKAEKSVVLINDTMSGTSGYGFGGSSTSSAAGTGVVITAGGEVVTNAHVVNGASTIKVTLADGSTHSATVLGMDTTKDLAVLKVSGVSGLTPATFADSGSAQVGDSVLAIGNAEGYGGSPSVTAGILSAKNRSLSSSQSGSSGENLTGLLQTDAAINPGNSGGPLVDAAGDVLGIDTAVATGTSSEPAQNIGFVIPSNTVVAAIPTLEKGAGQAQSARQGSTPVLGVAVSDDPSGRGALVEQVQPGSGAAKAGLQTGDIVTALSGRQVTSASDLSSAIATDSVGQTVRLTLTRNGSVLTVRATLGS